MLGYWSRKNCWAVLVAPAGMRGKAILWPTLVGFVPVRSHPRASRVFLRRFAWIRSITAWRTGVSALAVSLLEPSG